MSICMRKRSQNKHKRERFASACENFFNHIESTFARRRRARSEMAVAPCGASQSAARDENCQMKSSSETTHAISHSELFIAIPRGKLRLYRWRRISSRRVISSVMPITGLDDIKANCAGFERRNGSNVGRVKPDPLLLFRLLLCDIKLRRAK